MIKTQSLLLNLKSRSATILLGTLLLSLSLSPIQASAKSCTLPWGGQLAEGDSTIAWNYSMPPPGTHCRSEIRSCESGFLTGSFSAPHCAEPARWFYVPLALPNASLKISSAAQYLGASPK